MPLPASGPISMSSINQEFGFDSNFTMSLGNSRVRTLSGISTGQVKMGGNLYSKNAAPVWNTASGSIGSDFTQRSSTFSATATSPFPVQYSVSAGSIPPGMTLNTNTGTISGTPSGVADYSVTTFNFTLLASSIGISRVLARPFSISVTSRFVGFRCSTAGELGVCSDTAPQGYVFNRVDFSSYGTPNGSCGSFSFGGCNSGGSNGYNPTPTTSYAISASNGQWGDPCPGVPKRMYVQMSFGPF